MTYHQYGTLKHIVYNNVYVQQSARKLHGTTFWSLAKRGWITHNDGLLVLTEKGLEAYNSYSHAKANFRKVEKDLTDNVKSLLHLGRLLTMRKAG